MLNNLGARIRIFFGRDSISDDVRVDVEDIANIGHDTINEIEKKINKVLDKVEKIEKKAGFFSNLFSCFTCMGDNDERIQEPKKIKVAPYHSKEQLATLERIKAKYSRKIEGTKGHDAARAA